jgi:hypothetical protein
MESPYKEVYDAVDRFYSSIDTAEESRMYEAKIYWAHSALYWYHQILEQYWVIVFNSSLHEEGVTCEELESDGRFKFLWRAGFANPICRLFQQGILTAMVTS